MHSCGVPSSCNGMKLAGLTVVHLLIVMSGKVSNVEYAIHLEGVRTNFPCSNSFVTL